MKYNIQKTVIIVLITSSLLFSGCSFFNPKSEALQKIEELGKDGLFDCKDLDTLIDFVQAKSSDRTFHKMLKNGKADRSLIQAYVKDNFKKGTLSIDLCEEVQESPNFSIYLENSASMDGYVKGVSNFEAVLSKLVIDLHYHYDPQHVKFNFINSEVYPADISKVDKFFSSLEPGVAPFKVGNQFVSELNQCFEKILDTLTTQEVAIFVSDCIYSLEKGRDSKEGLVYQENLTKNAFLQRLKKADFSTAILQFSAGFNGVYYDYKNQKTHLRNVARPYYLWLMGDNDAVRALLANIKMDNLPGYQNSFFLAPKRGDNPRSQYLATHSKGQAHYRPSEPTSLKKIKFADGVFQFSIALDLHGFSGKEALVDLKNYAVNAGARIVAMQEIPKNNQPALIKHNDWNRIQNESYSHVMTIEVAQKDFPNQLNIRYKSQIPSWVSKSSTLDDADIQHSLQQTFGLENLVQGVYEAYKTFNKHQDALFEINYTLTK